METVSLTIELPKASVMFFEEYAKRHHLSIAEIISSWITQLRSSEECTLHPDMKKSSGIVPEYLDEPADPDYIEKKRHPSAHDVAEDDKSENLAQWEAISAILQEASTLDIPRRSIDEILHDIHEFRESE